MTKELETSRRYAGMIRLSIRGFMEAVARAAVRQAAGGQEAPELLRPLEVAQRQLTTSIVRLVQHERDVGFGFGAASERDSLFELASAHLHAADRRADHGAADAIQRLIEAARRQAVMKPGPPDSLTQQVLAGD